MKICYSCKEQKPDCEFNKNRTRKDGLATNCKDCNKVVSRLYYKENKDLHIKNVRYRKKVCLTKLHRFMMEYLNDKVCVDCGNSDSTLLES